MSDMPIKMCLPVLSSAPKQKHTLGSNLVSELDTILKFRIVSLWVGLRTETLTFQASELEPESKCLEDRIVCHFSPKKTLWIGNDNTVSSSRNQKRVLDMLCHLSLGTGHGLMFDLGTVSKR